MWSTAPASRRVPFLPADCFVLAWDAFVRRTRQGGHVSQSVIEALFFNEHGDRLNVTLSRREGALTPDEQRPMMARLREDLLGPERMSGAKADV